MKYIYNDQEVKMLSVDGNLVWMTVSEPSTIVGNAGDINPTIDLTEDKERLAIAIHNARIEHRYTLDYLAKISGVTKKAIIEYEQCKVNPGMENLMRLSYALDIKIFNF